MADYFERLGLPRRFSVDPATVEREYLARSRELHPDFHHLGGDLEQRTSLELTAALNEGYVTLRDPFRRGEYLLTLLGGPSAREEKNLDQGFLMEMMEFRERIEEARAEPERLQEIEAELTARLAEFATEIGNQFTKLELGTDLPPTRLGIRKTLNAAKTIQSLLRDLRAE